MRVLHVYRTYFPDTQGGLEEVIRQICLSTKRSGIESRVFSLSSNPTPAVLQREEATVHRVKRDLELASCSISFTARSEFKKLASWADIIHYHFPWPFADVLHFMVRPQCPTLVTYHSDIVRQRFLNLIYAPLMKTFLRSVDRIVCTSPNYFATSDVLGRYQRKVEVIPIGIDERTYPSLTDCRVNEAKREFGEDFFLFVGVLRYYKGLHILLDAIKGAPYRVVIVGSGPIESELKQQASELGLDNVVFAGHVDDQLKLALLHLSRGVVFPSYLRSEAFGVTLLEGAMSRRPLISTEVGSGTSHVNKDGETGLVVPPGSARELRSALDWLHHHPDEATMMGNRARQRYETLFSGVQMGDQYAEVYKSLIGRQRKSTSGRLLPES